MILFNLSRLVLNVVMSCTMCLYVLPSIATGSTSSSVMLGWRGGRNVRGRGRDESPSHEEAVPWNEAGRPPVFKRGRLCKRK